jgi:hypothetical protein
MTHRARVVRTVPSHWLPVMLPKRETELARQQAGRHFYDQRHFAASRPGSACPACSWATVVVAKCETGEVPERTPPDADLPLNLRQPRFAAAVREDDPVVKGIADNRSPRGGWPNTPIAPLTINHKEATTPPRITGAIT